MWYLKFLCECIILLDFWKLDNVLLKLGFGLVFILNGGLNVCEKGLI